MAEKLDAPFETVNAAVRAIIAVQTVLAMVACGPSPRPVTLTTNNGWPTTLGNARRAAFENERVPDSLDVAWDIDAGSGLRAGMIVTDSVLFVGTTNRQLFAFGTRSGRRFWNQRVEGELGSELVRSGRTLFATTAEWNGSVHARDIERGRRVWRREIGGARHSPLVEGGIVYAVSDLGRAYALRSEDGEQLWRASFAGSAAATPVGIGAVLIVTSTLDTIYRIAKRDGAIQARGHIDSSVSAPPALAGDLIILPTHGGSVLAVDTATLEVRWRVDTNAPVLAAPIVARDGTIHVINRDSEVWRITDGQGTKIVSLNGTVTTSFTLARERYVVGMVDGSVLVVAPDGRIIAQHKFNDSVAAPVAVHAGALYVPLLSGRIVKLR
ncbi:MAG: outer membrane protein assembly factor BamB family protein [Gemmatimonadota bacterium]